MGSREFWWPNSAGIAFIWCETMTSKRILTETQRLANIASAARSAAANPERTRDNKRNYYYRHRERILATHKEKLAAKAKPPRPAPKGRDPEKARMRRRKWQEKNRDKKNLAQRLKRASSLTEVRAKEVAYRKTRADAIKESQRRWLKDNREARNTFSRKRRARKHQAPGSHTDEDIKRIRLAQRDRCACCGQRLIGKGHVDHIVALSKGGSNWANNLQLLCRFCNSSKHNRDPIEFMQSRGRLI